MPGDPVIVVPEGLAAHPQTGEVLAEPSFLFRAVLDHVISRYRDSDVFIAPANTFGGPVSEQAAAQRYLGVAGMSRVFAFECNTGGYIDTFGNALQLRRWLLVHRRWPLPAAHLVAGRLHIARAKLCFRRHGFSLKSADAVAYVIPQKEHLVPRLFYYRYPLLHRVYEALAFARDRLRPVSTEGVA